MCESNLTIKQVRKCDKICRLYISSKDLEKAYYMVNREALWQVLKMSDMGGELLNGTKRVYVNSQACIRIKGGESGCFRIDSGVRQGCVMFP